MDSWRSEGENEEERERHEIRIEVATVIPSPVVMMRADISPII